MLIFFAILLLASCKTSQLTQTPVVDGTLSSTIDLAHTNEVPQHTEVPQVVVQESPTAYPAPGQAGIVTQTPLVMASETTMVITTLNSETQAPYPPPATTIAVSSPTTVGAYPNPQTVSTPFSPYPGPATPVASPQPTTNPTSTQALPTATEAPPASPTVTATPTAIPTRIFIRTEIIPTDPNTFQAISGRAQLVEFFAFWSPLSRSMAPVVHLLEDQYDDRVNFIYLDIDDPLNSLYKGLMGNQLPPVFFLLDAQGVVQNEWIGYVSEIELENAIQQAAQ